MISETIALLGRKGEDKITGFKGVVPDGRWFDVNRIAISGDPIMHAPDFAARAITPADYDRGPAEKPAFYSLPSKA